MRILVTGAGGQLGREVVAAAQAHGEVMGLTRAELDVTDPAAVRRAVEAWRPDVVVHTAAVTDVDAAERDPATAWRVNVLGTRSVALAARAVGAAMVHVSTDYVFAGDKGAPYHEFDPPRPLQEYGRSKWAAEEEVRRLVPEHYVVRTAWVYGEREDRNFVARILRAAEGREEIPVVADQVSSPTWARELAAVLVPLAKTGLPGVYHVAGGGECSRARWAREILRLAGSSCRVREVFSDAFPTPARRPQRTSLTSVCWGWTGLPDLPPWEDSLARFFQERGG